MKVRIGDRFEFVGASGRYKDSVWEAISMCNSKYWTCKCISAKSKHLVGSTDEWRLSSNTAWKYLGNYTKTDKFTELYNLLNS